MSTASYLVSLGDVLPHYLVVPPTEHDYAAAVSGQDHAVPDTPSGPSGAGGHVPTAVMNAYGAELVELCLMYLQ